LSKSQDAQAFFNIYQNQVFMQFLKLLVPNLDQQRTLIFLPDVASGNAIPRIFQQTFPTLQVPHQTEENFACLKAVIETIFAKLISTIRTCTAVDNTGQCGSPHQLLMQITVFAKPSKSQLAQN
jgi:hypothetical protein